MQIRNARIVPGSHPKRVKRKTRHTDPHPLSITASGGKRRQSRYRMMSMNRSFPVILTLESSISLSDLLLFICETDKESDDRSRQLSDASEEERQQYYPAPLVEHGKRREDEAQHNADDEVHRFHFAVLIVTHLAYIPGSQSCRFHSMESVFDHDRQGSVLQYNLSRSMFYKF